MANNEANTKIKVLIVDESEIVRIYLRDIFWINGFENYCELMSATNLNDAEAIVADPKTRPDVIFLALSLRKKVDGHTHIDPKNSFAFVRSIKSDPALQHIKVFIISSLLKEQFEKDIAESKVDKYISKDQNLPKDMIPIIKSFTGAMQPTA